VLTYHTSDRRAAELERYFDEARGIDRTCLPRDVGNGSKVKAHR
jgi:hypothetical protein